MPFQPINFLQGPTAGGGLAQGLESGIAAALKVKQMQQEQENAKYENALRQAQTNYYNSPEYKQLQQAQAKKALADASEAGLKQKLLENFLGPNFGGAGVTPQLQNNSMLKNLGANADQINQALLRHVLGIPPELPGEQAQRQLDLFQKEIEIRNKNEMTGPIKNKLLGQINSIDQMLPTLSELTKEENFVPRGSLSSLLGYGQGKALQNQIIDLAEGSLKAGNFPRTKGSYSDVKSKFTPSIGQSAKDYTANIKKVYNELLERRNQIQNALDTGKISESDAEFLKPYELEEKKQSNSNQIKSTEKAGYSSDIGNPPFIKSQEKIVPITINGEIYDVPESKVSLFKKAKGIK